MTTAPDDRPQPSRDAGFFNIGRRQPAEVISEGVIFFPSFSGSTVIVCDGEILLVDAGARWFASRSVEDLRSNHSQAPVHTIVYTHGHIDHASGTQAWLDDARDRGYARPRVLAHRDLPARFDRYRMLGPQNDFINHVQFGLPESVRPFATTSWVYPDEVYSDAIVTTVGNERFELYHARGETDDETWVWCPGRRVLCTGDTFVWSSPNAGNPYKVQRYALDWARALEEMAALRPLHLLPGHGSALSGEDTIQDALTSTAAFLRSIHDQVVAKMNEGKWLEDILREIEYPPTDRPWLRPVYDHPEFIARNVYRLYGGWYNGDPADILPAHSHDIARELVGVCGADKLLERARALRSAGELQLACHVADFVRKGDPDNREAWELWRDLFAARVDKESSLMARGAFRSAMREAEANLKRLGG